MALSRDQKKLQAIRRAERRLMHRLSDIDWEEDVLSLEVEALGEPGGSLELPAAQFAELEYEDDE